MLARGTVSRKVGFWLVDNFLTHLTITKGCEKPLVMVK